MIAILMYLFVSWMIFQTLSIISLVVQFYMKPQKYHLTNYRELAEKISKEAKEQSDHE